MSALERFARNNHSVRARRERLLLKPKPVHVSDDGHSHSLFSRRRDIINQVLSPTIKHFSFDGSSFSRRSPSPRDHSSDSQSSGDDESVEQEWDQAELLELSDSVRAGLRGNNNDNVALALGVGPEADKLSSFLEAALNDEDRKYPTLDFETIEYARLDKMVDEILLFADTMGTSSSSGGGLPASSEHLLRFRADVSLVKSLRRLWRRRFREHFFMMDQHRCAVLVDGGRLKDVSFSNSLEYDLGKWHTPKLAGPVSEVEGNQTFEAGHWWLNTTCAERDGIINDSQEMPTKGRYGFTALPLLTGSEELINDNTVKYVREGRMADMHIALISQVGRQIRILRGYRLKSMFAPVAGLRYDGIYTIKQYGCKFDSKISKYRLELTLERRKDQRPFDDVRKMPKPSQLDDWALYEKLEGDKVKMLLGQTGYLSWKLRQQEEKVNRDEWRRAKMFRASFSTQGSAARST